MKMSKIVLSLMLCVAMVIGLLPVNVFATEPDYAYISVSEEGQFVLDQNGEALAYRAVSLDELTTIDLNEYNLSDYLYDKDGDGNYEVTALHLYIYIHENILGLDWNDVTVSGGAGSIYFEGGLFGYEDENLRYNYNGAYPADENGWGFTADRIVLSDGDYFDVAHYSDWSFYMDSAYGFHYFTDESDAISISYAAEVGTALPLKLILVGGGMGMTDVYTAEAGYTVYYGQSIGDAIGSVTTDDSGAVSISFSDAGTYYVWCDGGEGVDMAPGAIVSSPACAVVTVTGDVGCQEHTVEIDQAVAATCTETGLTEGKHCSSCGEVLAEQEVIPATGHSYGDWTVTKAPTFSAEGQQEKTCVHCGDVISEVLPVATGKVEKWNISLTDALQVNLHLSVSASIESTATVKLVAGNTVVTYDVADLEKTEECLYVASIKLAAVQMADDIVVLILNHNEIGGYANYTIRQYADAVLADESLSQYHTLVKEMLNYGAAAQTYFDYCEDNLADEGITGTGTEAIPETADQELAVSGLAEGVSFYAASLSYRDKIAVRFYFSFSGDIKQCSFRANGQTCDPSLKNGWYYVGISDITPENLDQVIELTVTDADGNVLTVSYSPMNYIVRMNEKGSEELKALLTALYNYHLAAKEVAATKG